MKIFRIHLSSWTASFRYPNMISGFQATLPVPPLSTIYGLISAAMGEYFYPVEKDIGFVFRSETKAQDLETIYQMNQGLKDIKSNVIMREFLVDNDLWLYTLNEKIAMSFQKPFFPLLLGRSGDLASVLSIEEMSITIMKELKYLRGTIVPFNTKHRIAAPIHALPLYFSNEIPRRNIGTKPFYLLDSKYRQTTPLEAYGFFDEQNNWEVYWQE